MNLLRIGMSLFILGIRLWVARVFLLSGLQKITDWQATLYLFAQEYKVPLLPPEIAAYLATTFELGCSTLLIIGLATRLATLPLLVMTAVIQFTYPGHIEHLYWAIALFIILIYGPGLLSVDHLISKYKSRSLR